MAELNRCVDELEEAGRELHKVLCKLRRLAEAEELRRLAKQRPTDFAAAQIRSMIAARRLWHECIGEGEGDPSWALLMELFARRLEGRPVAISALAEAAGVPQTTSLRWIGRLDDRGLIARRPHPEHDRTVLVDLTDEAEDRLRRYLAVALRLSPWVL